MRKVLLGVLLLVGAAVGEEVPQGDPSVKSGTYKGSASYVPWSHIWWPMSDGYLGRGWNGKQTFVYNSTTKQYDLNTTLPAVNDLSPLAKYDKFVGNDLKSGAAKYEVTDQGWWYHHVYGARKEKFQKDGVDFSWWGHCNGWAAACALEAEPVSSLDAKGIRFEVADLKGMLTESYFGCASSFSGSRYNDPDKELTSSYNKAKELLNKLNSGSPANVTEYKKWYEKAYNTTLSSSYTPAWYKSALENYIKNYDKNYGNDSASFQDINPDVFHKILTKVIGEQKGVVVFDITAGAAVWNYPAYAYESKITYKSKKKINGVWRKVWKVTTTVSYADDGVSESLLGTETFTKTYTYELYTDPSTAKIKGGKWTGQSYTEHPDFAWFPKYNSTGADYSENSKLLYGKILEILPVKHMAKDGKPVQLFANAKGSQAQRTATSPITWGNPVTTGTQVTLSVQTSLTNVAKVQYFEQKVNGTWGNPQVTRDPLVLLGEGLSLVKTLSSGKHMVVAQAFDATGRLLAVDEITVKVQ